MQKKNIRLYSTLFGTSLMFAAGVAFAQDPEVPPRSDEPTNMEPPSAQDPYAPGNSVPSTDVDNNDGHSHAIDYSPTNPSDTDRNTGDADVDHRPSLPSEIGMSVLIGGGVTGFTDSDATNLTDAGGSWTARLVLGTRSIIGFEAAYVGGAQNITALNLDTNSMLLSSAAEGDIRLNILTGVWQPYVLAGLAYKRYDIVNSNFNTSDVRDSDEVGEVPLGAGLAFRWDGFVADARVTFNPAFDSDLLPAAGGDRLNLSTWNANARVGFEF